MSTMISIPKFYGDLVFYIRSVENDGGVLHRGLYKARQYWLERLHHALLGMVQTIVGWCRTSLHHLPEMHHSAQRHGAGRLSPPDVWEGWWKGFQPTLYNVGTHRKE